MSDTFVEKIRYEADIDDLKAKLRDIGKHHGDTAGATDRETGRMRAAWDKVSGGIGSAITAIGKVAAVVGVAAVATIGAVGKQSIEAASSLNESMSKIDAVFGENADQLNAWADTADRAFGQSKRQALEAAGSYGNLLQAFGVATKPAMEMSTTLTQLASDLASFNNTSVDEALQALQSGLSGETEPLKRYGVAINEARLKAKALELGLVEATVSQDDLAAANERVRRAMIAQSEAIAKHGADSEQARRAAFDLDAANQKLADTLEGKMPAALTEAQKAQAAYALIMEDTSLAQGDFERTSDGLANKQRILAARLENAKAAIGQALLPAMTAAVGFIADKFIPRAQELAERYMPRLRAGFESVAAFVRENWPTMQAIIQRVVEAVGNGIGWISTNIVPALVAAFTATVTWVRDNWPQIRATIAELVDWLQTNAWPVILAVVDGLKAAFTDAVAWVRENWPEIRETIESTIGAIQVIIETAVAIITEIWRRWGDEITVFLQGAWDAIKGIIDGALTVIRGVIQTITSLIRGDWSGAWDGIKAIVDGVWKTIISIVSLALDALKLALKVGWDLIKLGVAAVWNEIKDFIDDTWSSIKAYVSEGVDEIIGSIAGLPGGISSAVAGAFDSIWTNFKRVVNRVIDAWNSLELPGFTIGGWDPPGPGSFPSFTVPPVGVPNIPRLAGGGVAYGPLLAMIGDNPNARNDPEVVAPQSMIREALRSELAAQAGLTLRPGDRVTLVLEGNPVTAIVQAREGELVGQLLAGAR